MTQSVTTGTVLGRYSLTEVIGQGGMSVVYRARDTALHREVAVKVMHGFLAVQKEARERFRREAIAVANLAHPHIIEVFDFSDEDAEVSYIVAELVDGQALSEFLGKKPLSPPEAVLLLALPVAQALAHAHQAGMVHRDLKPENVLVDQRGTVKLTDFGIARMLDHQTLTITGTLLGSPAYMAPEYIDGQEPDERADVFSFGAMLYQMLCGKLPFSGPSPHALLKRIASGEYVPVNQQNPSVHSDIAALVHSCLAISPLDRPQNGGELADLIAALIDGLQMQPSGATLLLADRQKYSAELRQALERVYLARGKEHLNGGRRGPAMADFDRLLSLNPDHTEVRQLISTSRLRRQMLRIAVMGLMGIGGALLVTAMAVFLPPLTFGPSATPTAQRSPEKSRVIPPAKSTAERQLLEPTPEPRNVIVRTQLTGRGTLVIDPDTGAMQNHSVGTGDTPILLAAGPHRLQLLDSAGHAVEADLVVPESGIIPPVTLQIKPPTGPRTAIVPADRPQPRKRSVSFNAKAWVTVYVDQDTEPAVQGKFGRFELDLYDGMHRLRFTNDYAKTLNLDLLVGEGQPPGVQVINLLPRDARLRLTGLPPGTLQLEVGGVSRTITDINRNDPILVSLEKSRTQDIVIRKTGFRGVRRTVTFTPGKTKILDATLQRL